MAIDFPASPSVSDTHTVGDTTWSWNGTYWGRSANTAKFSAADTAPSSPTLGDLWYESDTGKTFIYYDTTWVELGHASDGQSFKVGDTIPAANVSNAGDIWFESDSGKTFMYYTDGNSSQWVELGHAAENLLLTASDTAPTSPDPGQFWYESDTGRTFIRYDGTWVEMGHAADGMTFKLGDNLPSASTTNTGDIWFESDSGGAYIYYNDGSSSQWVELGHSVSGVNVNIDGGVASTNYGGLFALNGGSA